MQNRTSTKWTVVVVTLLLVGTPMVADEKKDAEQKKLLVGKWVLVKKEVKDDLPIGTVIEFRNDDTLTLSVKAPGIDLEVKGKFELEDGTLSVTLEGQPGKEQTKKNKIAKLDMKMLVLIDEGKKFTLSRK